MLPVQEIERSPPSPTPPTQNTISTRPPSRMAGALLGTYGMESPGGLSERLCRALDTRVMSAELAECLAKLFPAACSIHLAFRFLAPGDHEDLIASVGDFLQSGDLTLGLHPIGASASGAAILRGEAVWVTRTEHDDVYDVEGWACYATPLYVPTPSPGEKAASDAALAPSIPIPGCGSRPAAAPASQEPTAALAVSFRGFSPPDESLRRRAAVLSAHLQAAVGRTLPALYEQLSILLSREGGPGGGGSGSEEEEGRSPGEEGEEEDEENGDESGELEDGRQWVPEGREAWEDWEQPGPESPGAGGLGADAERAIQRGKQVAKGAADFVPSLPGPSPGMSVPHAPAIRTAPWQEGPSSRAATQTRASTREGKSLTSVRVEALFAGVAMAVLAWAWNRRGGWGWATQVV